MRAMFIDHPRDERIWAHPLQYRLGDDLLVSPVTEPGATEWSTYLPEAGERWVDAWTGEPHAGGQLVTRAVPLELIPVYVRESAWERLAPVFTPA
jgi:alpha-glucosidase (family GH31 glycosyl hydrolase)